MNKIINYLVILLLVTISSNINLAQKKSAAYMLSSLDNNTSKTYITRTQSLLNQLSSKYNISETEVGDKMVVLCHNLLRDKYGINQKIQDTMEDINKVNMSYPSKEDFTKLLVVYGTMRNSGQSREEVLTRLNAAIQYDRDALIYFLINNYSSLKLQI